MRFKMFRARQDEDDRRDRVIADAVRALSISRYADAQLARYRPLPRGTTASTDDMVRKYGGLLH